MAEHELDDVDVRRGARVPVGGDVLRWDELYLFASVRYFTSEEHSTANALCERLLALEPDCPVPVVARIDARLAEQQMAGERFGDAPHDGDVWRLSLAALKSDAVDRFQSPFAVLDGDRRDRLILYVRDLGSQRWHDMSAERVWNLWTGHACTAFYSHPFAWSGHDTRL